MGIRMEKIYSAKTLDEAKAFAYEYFASMGIDESNIDFEIIEQPVKKLFGTKGEYRIRAVAGGNNDNQLKKENEKPTVKTEKKIENKIPSEKAVHQTSENYDGKFSTAVSYLTKILNALGAEDFIINVIEKEELTILDIVGEKLGIAIGRRGETLDSLQYLVILANNRQNEQYSRISVDCNGYREKRRETLETLAARTAQKVLKQGRRITLEPMNPYERRIIHSMVAEIEGVYSNSIGEEPYRKVVISANVPKSRRDSGGGRENRDGGERRHVPNAGKSYRQSTGFSTSFEREYKRTPSEPIEISQDTVDMEKNTSLYGKIEL